MKPHHHYKIAQTLAGALDTQFNIFGFRFGFDPLLNFIPGLGYFVSLGLALYIIFIAKMLEVPQTHINKMVRNTIVDFIIGLVPFLGWVGDFFFKANTRNLQYIERHLKTQSNIIDGELIPEHATKQTLSEKTR